MKTKPASRRFQPFQFRQHGVALVLVMWVLVLLMVIAGSLTVIQRNEIGMTTSMLREREARAAIEAGHYYMIYRITNRQGVQPEFEWKADGAMRNWEFDGKQVGIAASPENGRIDLNVASPDILEKLFLEIGLEAAAAEAIRDAILDWKDTDDAHRLFGAEDNDYASAGLPYGAKDARFDTIEELRQVLGITSEIYRSVAPALTIYSRQRTVNPLFAQSLVLYALPGMDRATADAYILERNANLEQGHPAQMPVGMSGKYVSPSGVQVYRLYAETEGANGTMVKGEMVIRLGRKPGQGHIAQTRPRGNYTIIEKNYTPLTRPFASVEKEQATLQ